MSPTASPQATYRRRRRLSGGSRISRNRIADRMFPRRSSARTSAVAADGAFLPWPAAWGADGREIVAIVAIFATVAIVSTPVVGNAVEVGAADGEGLGRGVGWGGAGCATGAVTTSTSSKRRGRRGRATGGGSAGRTSITSS